jgi:proprotein convertase subtilisin/kexin type 5
MCSLLIPNCNACLTRSTCTVCATGYSLVAGQCMYVCPTPKIGCLDCVITGNPCSNCDTTLLFELDLSSGNCICKSGYGLALDNSCILCSQLIPNCDACSTTSVCTQCAVDYVLSGPTQCTFVCPYAQITGCLDCIMPGNSCLNCDTNLFF